MNIGSNLSHELWSSILKLYCDEVNSRGENLFSNIVADVLFQKGDCEKSDLELIKQRFERSDDPYLHSLVLEIDAICYGELIQSVREEGLHSQG